jgi:hypothetical protein
MTVLSSRVVRPVVVLQPPRRAALQTKSTETISPSPDDVYTSVDFNIAVE